MKLFMTRMAKKAGQMAVGHLGNVKISNKSVKNIVTNADVEVENFIISEIKEKYPDHEIVAEESDQSSKKSEFVWYIDPIDGTTNYSHTDPHFCVSIALAEKNILKYACVYLPMFNELYYAEKGQGSYLNDKKINVSRNQNLNKSNVVVGLSPYDSKIDQKYKVFRYFMVNGERAKDYGFCAGELSFLAAGRCDGFIKSGQNPWDIAAGILLVEEAGGKVTDKNGNQVNISKNKHDLVISNGLIHNQLMKVMKNEQNYWY